MKSLPASIILLFVFSTIANAQCDTLWPPNTTPIIHNNYCNTFCDHIKNTYNEDQKVCKKVYLEIPNPTGGPPLLFEIPNQKEVYFDVGGVTYKRVCTKPAIGSPSCTNKTISRFKLEDIISGRVELPIRSFTREELEAQGFTVCVGQCEATITSASQCSTCTAANRGCCNRCSGRKRIFGRLLLRRCCR